MTVLSGALSSSAVSSYEYDTSTGLLILTFRKPPPGPYYYYNVPQSLFRAFMNSSSRGQAFNALIRGRYE